MYLYWLSSYRLNLLALFYMQQLNLLIPIEYLQREVLVELYRGWNVNISEAKPLDSTIKRPTFLHSGMMIGFFHFYQSPNTTQDVISPFKGKSFLVDTFLLLVNCYANRCHSTPKIESQSEQVI